MKQNSQPTVREIARQPTRPVGETTQAKSHSIRQVRTLIADDSPLVLKTLTQILKLEGYFALVGTATDGCQAIRLALTMQPELILMDYRMPHINGIEAAQNIKQFKDPPLIIMVTSDDTPRCKAMAKAAGVDGFVSKGGDLHAQLRAIFHALFNFEARPFPCQSQPKTPPSA